MQGLMVILGLLSCTDGGKDDSAGDSGASEPFCREVSFLFDDGPRDDDGTCLKGLIEEIARVDPGEDFSNASSGVGDFESVSQATLSALHGQLNGHLISAGATDNDEAYDRVCAEYTSRMQNQPPHGEDVGVVCDAAEQWAAEASLNAWFSCQSVYLSDAMTATLGGLTAQDETLAFWSRIWPANGTDPNLIWLPMYLAMYHGGSPAVLAYDNGSQGTLAILELGLEVHGEPTRVEAFWNFINDPFDPTTYDGSSPSDWSDLDIILPSRITWREDGVVQAWELGQTVPAPFSTAFARAFGIIDPCLSGRRDSESGAVAGGVEGSCDNSFERMMATVHELQTITPFSGSALSTCERSPYDYTLD